MKKKYPGPPRHIYLSDILEEDPESVRFRVMPGYGGLLFEGHFCISEAEAKNLRRHINHLWPRKNSTPPPPKETK